MNAEDWTLPDWFPSTGWSTCLVNACLIFDQKAGNAWTFVN
ncbi:MAG TPA: hypothetical protein VLE96_00255 [Chlamydiales bacterium]|nr:hypothetical protein [Chlamydiales bacterium]